MVSVGRILRSHDKSGEVKLRLFEFDGIDLAGVERMFIGREGDAKEFVVESARPRGRDIILKLAGVDSLSQADRLADSYVWIAESSLPPLERGGFYVFELVGCRVIDPAGDELGTVSDVIIVGTGSLLAVDRRGREVLIPFHESFCKEVNLSAREIRVDLPEELLDLNES